MAKASDNRYNAPYHQRLRGRAEKKAQPTSKQFENMSHEQIAELVHDLQVHQIELELQYQELQVIGEQLRESANRYQSLFETAPVGYFTLDKNGILHEVNTTFSTLFRYGRDTIINKPIADFILPESQKAFYIFMRQAFQHKVFPDLELQFKRGDGTTFYGLIQSNWETEKEMSQVARMTVMNITSRKKAEFEVKKAKNEWERTFQSVSDVIILLDSQQRIIRTNESAAQIAGVAHDKLMGRLCHEVLSGRSEWCENCPLNSIRNEPGVSVSGEVYNPALDKSFQVSVSPIANSQGALNGYVCIAHDITERKRIREELEQSRKMEAIGTLAGGIAHDFNNILQAILGYAELSKIDLANGLTSTVDKNLEAIVKSGTRARNLVQQILMFSRKSVQASQPLLLNQALEECLLLLRPTIPSTIVMDSKFTLDDTYILASADQIQQIMINLCSNAEYAMRPEGGTLSIALHSFDAPHPWSVSGKSLPPGTYVQLTVKDTGHGMSKETLMKIMEPFYTTKGVGEGTGLGLSIIYGIVELLEGGLSVESTLEVGTEISVFLPTISELAGVLEEDEQAKTFSETAPCSSPKRILLVDDEKAIVQMGQRIFEGLGHTATICQNSMEALDLFTTNPDKFDLVITDQTMPVLSGSELAKKILEIAPDTPIVLCTGFSAIIDERQARKIGIKHFAMKPMSLNSYTKIIDDIFS